MKGLSVLCGFLLYYFYRLLFFSAAFLFNVIFFSSSPVAGWMGSSFLSVGCCEGLLVVS